MQNSPFLSQQWLRPLLVLMRVFMRDGQAELAWLVGLNTKMVHTQHGHPSQ